MLSLENYYPGFLGTTNPFWLQTDQTLQPVQQTTPVILIESMHFNTQILFTTLLKIWSFEPVESGNFEDSIALIETQRPSVILLDCVNSIKESVAEIKLFKTNELSHKIPIIALSEIGGTAYQNQILDAGADKYLLKPIKYARLKNIIHYEIEKYQTLNKKFGGLL